MSPTLAPARTTTPDPVRSRSHPGPDRDRRHLRAVQDRPAAATRGRPRVHIVLGFGVGGLFFVLFAVAVLQTVLVQGQIHLDGLQADVAEAQVELQDLRAEVGRLESPARIADLAAAQGMVPAERVRSVVPRGEDGASRP